MKKTYYEKIGDEYVPVKEYDTDLNSSMNQGTHLVQCRPGGLSTWHDIDPAFAPMIAAGRYAEEKIVDAIAAASEMKPSKTPLTPEQCEAWYNLNRAFGSDMYTIQTASARDIALAGIRAMEDEAMKILKNPGVLAAYEHFMLLCKLAQTNEVE